MSVQKFIPEMSYENQSYTILPNSVIQHIKYAEAFLVWSYLISRNPDWDVIKTHIKNMYGYGDGKIKKIFKYLSDNNLIKYIRRRDKNGRLLKVEIRVLNGSLFNADSEKNSNEINDATTGSENHPVVHHTSGFGGTTKERLLQSKETNREKHSLPDDFEVSDDNKKLCLAKEIDLYHVYEKFKANAKSTNKKLHDWNAALTKWILDERKPKNDHNLNAKEKRGYDQTCEEAFQSIETPEQRKQAYLRHMESLGVPVNVTTM